MQPLLLLVAVVGIAAALPTLDTSPHILERTSAHPECVTPQPAEDPIKGSEWLCHPKEDEPVVQNPIRGKPWTWYPGRDTSCFSDITDDANGGVNCAPVDGHWLVSAASEFCTQIHGKLFSMKELINSYMTTGPAANHAPASAVAYFCRSGPALGVESTIKYTMDYTFCMQKGFLPIVNYCDNKGFDNKRGGVANYNNDKHGNDRLFWVIDPNPKVPSPYNRYDLKCINKPHYWYPAERNTEDLPLFRAPCRELYNENYSPRERAWKQQQPYERPPWDCVARTDGSDDGTWNAVKKDYGGDLEYDGNGTFPADALLKRGLAGTGWILDLGGAGWVCLGTRGVDEQGRTSCQLPETCA